MSGRRRRSVALDIGTGAVRLAVVGGGTSPAVEHTATIALPAGAVHGDGEIADTALVASTVHDLWRQSGARGRSVRVGLSSPRVVVRAVELPAMSDADLGNALRFQAEEHIPLPLDEAVVDFETIGTFEDADGTAMVRALVVAAPREMVAAALAAVAGAGLRAEAVDVAPLALAAAAHWCRDAAQDSEPEAIVAVDDDMTSVVVHEEGRPRFVRVVSGGRDRDGHLGRLVAEVSASLDYDAVQGGGVPVGAIILAGSEPGADHGSLDDELGATLELPVRRLDTPHDLVPLGLALRGRSPQRTVNLLPPEARHALASRRTGARVMAAAGALALLVTGVSITQQQRIDRDRAALEEQRERNATVERSLGSLAEARDLEGALATARQRAKAVAAAAPLDVAWARVLEDVALAMPTDTWLGSIQAQVTAPSATATPATAGNTIRFSATGADFPSLTRWLQQLEAVPYLEQVTLASATRVAMGAASVVEFESTAAIGKEAASARLQNLTEPA